jgi:hypothetical protein
MAPSRCGVGGGKKSSDETVEQNSSTGNRTLPTAMSVRNFVQSPRVLGFAGNLGRATKSPSFQAWDEGESSESLDSHVIVVYGCCTGGKACAPATVPTCKERRWGVQAGQPIIIINHNKIFIINTIYIENGWIVLCLSSYSYTMCTKESVVQRGSQIWMSATISTF